MAEEALLSEWRRTRDPALAERICQGPIDTKLAARLRATGAAPAGKVRVKALPDDPRVTDFILDALRRPRWPAAGASGLWTRILERLVTLRDVRALAPLEAAIAKPPVFLSMKTTRELVEKLKTTHAAIEKACAGIARPRRQVPFDLDQVLAPALARPWDDELKQVVADQLQQAGDPRGELIALQLAPATAATRKRAGALLKKHAQHLGGAIAKVTTRRHWEFEKGFLTSCQLLPTDRMIPRLGWELAAASPLWSTVQIVHLAGFGVPGWWPRRWAEDSALLSLREVVLEGGVLRRSGPLAGWDIASLRKGPRFAEPVRALAAQLNAGADRRRPALEALLKVHRG